MLRRSDGSWAKDEKRLQCRKGDQKSDEHVLDRPAALSVLLQAADVLEGQRLTTDGVQTIAPDDWQFVSYSSSDAEAVTHITAPCALSFMCVDLATAFRLPIRHVFVCGKSLLTGNGRLV
jgi:hypothetical protein